MDEIKKRAAQYALVNWGTIIPATGGLTLLLTTLATDLLSGGWGFIGFIALLGGAGYGLTNLLVFGDKFEARATKEVHDEERAEKNRNLDDLAGRLGRDDDQRDDRCLADLRRIYDDFVGDLDQGKISGYIGDGIRDQVEDLLQTCIGSLEHALELAETAATLRGLRKESLLAERTKTLREVREGINEFETLVAGVRTIGLKAKQDDLSRVREDLARSLRVAKRVDERMRDLHEGASPSYE